MQSVFRSAARRRISEGEINLNAAAVRLKTGWSEPLHESSGYGFWMILLIIDSECRIELITTAVTR
jgi:hypothetical protein